MGGATALHAKNRDRIQRHIRAAFGRRFLHVGRCSKLLPNKRILVSRLHVDKSSRGVIIIHSSR